MFYVVINKRGDLILDQYSYSETLLDYRPRYVNRPAWLPFNGLSLTKMANIERKYLRVERVSEPRKYSTVHFH
jgi:hypothetical protein